MHERQFIINNIKEYVKEFKDINSDVKVFNDEYYRRFMSCYTNVINLTVSGIDPSFDWRLFAKEYLRANMRCKINK